MLKNQQFNILEIAEKNHFKRFAYFQITLRDKINYDIELVDGYLSFSSDSKTHPKRHVIFGCQTYFRENQLIPPRFNTYFLTYKPILELYSYETTTIDILLNCSDKDLKQISKELKNNGPQTVVYELLEFFTYKYNLAACGNDFLDTRELCTGSLKCFLYYKNKKSNTWKSDDAIIAPSISLIPNNPNQKQNFQDIINTEIPPWKFFENKTMFDYKSYNNLDCVIDAAITFESYLIHTIKKSGTYRTYTSEYKNHLGFSSALEFCKKNELLDNSFATEFGNAFNRINAYRCMIVHGVIDSPIIDRRQAEEAFEIVNDIFSKINY